MTRLEYRREKDNLKNEEVSTEVMMKLSCDIGYFMVGVSYLILSLIEFVNKMVVGFFYGLPRIIRIVIVYGLMGLAIYQIGEFMRRL